MNGTMRQSISPSLARTSIASTVYRDNAVPAFVQKAKPSIISVKSNNSSASSPAVPPLPLLEMKKFGQNGGATVRPVVVKIPSSSDGVKGSPGSSIGGIKPTTLTITKKGGKSTLADLSASNQSPVGLGLRGANTHSIAASVATVESLHARGKHQVDDDSSDDDEPDTHERSRQSLLVKNQSPFTDDAADDSPSSKANESKRVSPFADENAV